MQKGTIKFFSEEKNYGFIKSDDGSEDVFFHGSVVKGYVKEGDAVTYSKTKTPKGWAANDVKKVNQ